MKKSVYLSSLLVICLSLFAVTAKAQIPVVTNPINDTTCQMDTAWFNVTATGTPTPTFIWQFSTNSGLSWDTVFNGGIYSGATSGSLRVIPHVAQSGNWYRAIAINTAGKDTSNPAMLLVDTAFAGTISGMTPVCVGATTALSSSVTGGTWSYLHHSIDTVTPAGVLKGLVFGRDTISYTIHNTCGAAVSKAYARVDTTVTVFPVTGPTHVCVGNVIILSNVNVIGTGVWTSATGNSSPASNGHVTGLTAGTDVITYTFTNACNSVSSSKNITVEVLPAAGTITGSSSPFCAGTWIHLTSSVSGGIWLSGTPAVAVVSTSGDVTGISQGSSVISYYQSNSCGASFSTFTTNIEVPAGTIGGNDSVGIDSTLMLTNPVPGGTWVSADTTIAKFTATAGLIKGIDTGVTTVTYSVTNSCGSSSSTIAMNVGPLPDPGVITGPDSVCVGDTISLDASVGGGTWTSLQDTLGTAWKFNDTTGKVAGIEYGKDTVAYVVTTAFGKSKIKRPIFVNQPPVVTITGPASVALSGSYTLIGSPSGGTFTTNNPAMASLIGYGFFVVVTPGTTIFTYTAKNTCGTRSNTFTIHLDGPSNVNGVADNGAKLSVFPNPSAGSLSVNLTSPVTEKVTVTITNVTGQVVKTFTGMTNTATNVTIDQPSGVYMLSAATADGTIHTARISVTN